MLVLIITDLGKPGPSLFLVGLLSYLLFYLVGLIRDLDNPFEYLNGKPGAADVSLDVLERNEDRLSVLAARQRSIAAPGRAAPPAGDPWSRRSERPSHGRGPWRSDMGTLGRDRSSRITPSALLVAAAVVLRGCGGDDAGEPQARAGATPVVRAAVPGPAVSGDYDTAVELVDSTCDGIEVEDNPTTVEQDGRHRHR